jgi:hypothetical protein
VSGEWLPSAREGGIPFLVVHRLRAPQTSPVFAAGDAPEQALTSQESQAIAEVLGKRVGPLRLDLRGRRLEDVGPAERVRAALHGLEPSLLIPLRPHGALDACLIVGPRRTGDVYTPTDVTLLASVAHHLSEELSVASGG